MYSIPFDTCMRCRQARVVPSYSTETVAPRCACIDLADPPKESCVDYEPAVQRALTAFTKEFAQQDERDILLRMQHFASTAGMALLDGNQKLYLSCLISTQALARLLTARAPRK